MAKGWLPMKHESNRIRHNATAHYSETLRDEDFAQSHSTMAEDNFFAMPPAEEAPAATPDDGGFTLLGEPAAPPADEPPAFAAAPVEDTPIILAPPPAEPVVETAEPEEPAEPSAMQKWNAEWQVTLAARKDEENSKKAEMVEAASAALEIFKKDRETKREAKMSKNREDEQAKLEAIEADLENDNSWQRVCKMVELSHDGADDTEDVKRMRDCLILLKNEPSRAGAVGA